MYHIERFEGDADYQCSRALASIVEGGLLGTAAEIYQQEGVWHLDLVWDLTDAMDTTLLLEVQSRCKDTYLRYIGGDTKEG